MKKKFKVKMMASVAAVATASGVDADTAYGIESAWSKLRALCWMLPPKSVVSPRLASGNLKPGGGMNRWMKPYERSMHGSKPIVPWRREAWRRRPRGQKLPTLMPSLWHSMTPAGKVWSEERRIRHSIPRWWWRFRYCQTDGLHQPGCC